MTRLSLVRFASCVGTLAAAAYACSSDTGIQNTSLGSGGGSGRGGSSAGTAPAPLTGGSTATGGSAGTASVGRGGTVSIDVDLDASVDSRVDEDAACGTGTASAKLKKVNMLIMYDRSWSMTQCANPEQTPPINQESLACLDGGPNRWDLTSQALIQFFQDPAAADLHIALRFFPHDSPAAGCNGYTMMGGMFPPFPPPGAGGTPGAAGSTGTGGAAGAAPNCDVNACAQPLVDLAPLAADPAPVDAHEGALVAAVNASAPPGPAMPNPNPNTPTSAALAGATQWATQYQSAHPEEQTVIVLVTDGEPMGCDTNAQNIAAIAGEAFDTLGVLTYVVGLTGASETQLDQIASAGGTEEAYFVSDGSTATQDLLDALIAIRGMALSCQFPVPTATSAGMDIDPRLINVNYTSGATGMETTFGLVGSAAECGSQLGWYYDDPAAPTQIMLCPATCETVTQDPNASLQILAGCEPVVITR